MTEPSAAEKAAALNGAFARQRGRGWQGEREGTRHRSACWGQTQFLEFVLRLWLKVYFSEVSFMTRKASRMGVDIRKLGN